MNDQDQLGASMGKHIVVADDDQDAVETIRLRLEANGYQVSTTMGERTVSDLLKVKPDLVLLDIMMPGVDGFSIIREIKRDPTLSQIPVIIVSGKPKEAMAELFGPEGIAGYITKPYDANDLLAQVKKILGS